MKISEQELRDLLERYLNDTATPDEREMLDRFFDSYKAGFSSRVLEGDAKLRQEIFEGIQSRIAKSNHKKNYRSVRLWLPWPRPFRFSPSPFSSME